jgi:hypothetical protein
MTALVLATQLSFGPHRVFFEKKGGQTAVVSELKKREKARRLLDDYAAGSRVDKFEHFSSAAGDFILLDFFNGFRGTSAVRACSTVYLWQMTKSGDLKLRDQLVYRCENTGVSEEPEVHIRYSVDRRQGRIR